ncbi:MAG: LysM peptidoglycan-binding domain-containing protein [Flavobacteriales bacterium]
MLALLLPHTTSAQRTWPVDSLMRTWPVQALPPSALSAGHGVVRAVDSDHLYEKIQQDAAGFPVFADSAVIRYADLYGQPKREEFRVLLGMAQAYFPMIEKALRREGLPEQLKYLPMALSAMNTRAGSTTGEAGLWMLTYPVAVRYGLTVSAEVDERRNDVKSTMVAVRYLKDLHARYNDWQLAVMAFTCGPANVARAQDRTDGMSTYRLLYPYFDDAHREVLPTLMAFIHLTARAAELGITAVDVRPWGSVDTVLTEEAMPFPLVASVMEMSTEQLRHLNPVLCGDLIPAGPFFLPAGTGQRFTRLSDSLEQASVAKALLPEAVPTVDVDRSIHYRVRSGDNLGAIAQKFHVTVSQLKSWNGLRSDRINAGRQLVIHVRTKVPRTTVPDPDADSPTNSVVPRKDPTYGTRSYTVQSGDSLYSIAERFPGVSATDLMRVNGITAAIKPGQRIEIPAHP